MDSSGWVKNGFTWDKPAHKACFDCKKAELREEEREFTDHNYRVLPGLSLAHILGNGVSCFPEPSLASSHIRWGVAFFSA